jgi:hypothetical protein
MSRPRGHLLAIALCASLGTAGCRDFHLSTTGIDIGPTPAHPGDTVVLSFVLNLVPTQRHTMKVFVDDTEHLSITSSELPAVPVIIELGDAADLITAYGTGQHVVYVRVEAHESGGATETRSAVLELAETP